MTAVTQKPTFVGLVARLEHKPASEGSRGRASNSSLYASSSEQGGCKV